LPGHAADGLQVDRPSGSGAVHIDEVNQLRAQGHEPLRDPLGTIRWRAHARGRARPVHQAGATVLDVYRWD
jgi:hypothetical protein